MAMMFWVYSRWDEQVGSLSYSDIETAETYQKINGEDTLTITTSRILAYGDRLLWNDDGVWREHVMDSSNESHSLYQENTWTLTNSLQSDLSAAWIDRFIAYDVTAEYMLTEILKLTNWTVGEIDADLGTAKFQLDRVTVYQALLQLAGAYGCEIEKRIIVGPAGVESREVSLRRNIGDDHGVRFEYARDLQGITKRVLDEKVITACYGYGKSTGSSSDGLSNYLKLNFNGKPYVEDIEALELWGIPDGEGGKRHVFGEYSNGECDNHAQLLEETTQYLGEHCMPSIEYNAQIPFLQLKGVQLGDTIQVIDKDFTPEIRIVTRAGELRRDLLSQETSSVSFGTIRSLVPEVYARAYMQASTSTQVADDLAKALATKVKTEEVETPQVVIKDGDAEAALTIDADGNLLWNGKKVVLESEQEEEVEE